MSEIATLIGTHDLIMFGLYRQRVSADDTTIRKTAIDCALPGTGWVILPRRRCRASATGKQRPTAQSRFCSFYQRGISVFTSAFCAVAVAGDPSKRSPASLLRSAPHGSQIQRIVTAFGDHLNFFAKAVNGNAPGIAGGRFSAIWAMICCPLLMPPRMPPMVVLETVFW